MVFVKTFLLKSGINVKFQVEKGSGGGNVFWILQVTCTWPLLYLIINFCSHEGRPLSQRNYIA